MATLQSINDQSSEPINIEIERRGSSVFKIVSIIVALALTGALLAGFLIWRRWHEEKTAPAQAAQTKVPDKPVLSARVQIFMDEPVRKGSQAIITGKVNNISNDNLSNLTLVAELTHRKDGGKEEIAFTTNPKELGPNQDGSYALTLTGDYSAFTITHVKAGSNLEEVGFKTAPGAKRPQQQPNGVNNVIANRPPPKKGDDFINTPDNPAKVP